MEKKIGNRGNLVKKLQYLLTPPSDGPKKIRDGSKLNTDKWVESLRNSLAFSYILVTEMTRKIVSNDVNNNLRDRLREVLEAYEKDDLKIGKDYHDIFFVYTINPTDWDIKDFSEALCAFKNMKFTRDIELNNQLESMENTYDQLVNDIYAKIDQSVTLRRQYVKEVKTFRTELNTLFKQTKVIDDRIVYDFPQLDALNTKLTALRGRQEQFKTCLYQLFSVIQTYNDQRIQWAGFVLNTTLSRKRPNKLGVMGF